MYFLILGFLKLLDHFKANFFSEISNLWVKNDSEIFLEWSKIKRFYGTLKDPNQQDFKDSKVIYPQKLSLIIYIIIRNFKAL